VLYYLLYQFVFRNYGTEPSAPALYKLFNVVQYVTFRTSMAAATSLLISLLLGGKVVRKLADLKFGQEIREEGPASHQEKRGTPTMGGVLIIGSVFISSILWARFDSLYLWLALGTTVCFAAIGFADDYIKIVKKRSLGLTGKQKLAGQLLTALIFFLILWQFGDYQWNLAIPFFKQTAQTNVSVIPPFLYAVFIAFVLLGSSNAVNLTDGLDGLAISVTFIAMSTLTALTYLASDARRAERLDITHNPQGAELTAFCGAMA